MRVLALPVGNDLLEVKINMWTSKEMVYWNGTEVSKKTHFLGSKHTFNVERANGPGVDVFRVITSYGWMGYRYDVYCNDKCLLGSSCRAPLHAGETMRENTVSRRNSGGGTVPRRTPMEELSLEELEKQLV